MFCCFHSTVSNSGKLNGLSIVIYKLLVSVPIILGGLAFVAFEKAGSMFSFFKLFRFRFRKYFVVFIQQSTVVNWSARKIRKYLYEKKNHISINIVNLINQFFFKSGKMLLYFFSWSDFYIEQHQHNVMYYNNEARWQLWKWKFLLNEQILLRIHSSIL